MFQGEAFKGGDWRDFKFRDWAFLQGEELSPAARAVTGFYGWNLAVGGHWGKVLGPCMAAGAYYMTVCYYDHFVTITM